VRILPPCTTRPIRLPNLARLPPVPGFFSHAGRREKLTLAFLHEFSDIIIEPVDRNDRINIDYIPTQVFTEFLRDFRFEGGRIDGLMYRSATGERGVNYVLFASPEEIEGASSARPFVAKNPWLRLVQVWHRR
jgi:hypothetical protein